MPINTSLSILVAVQLLLEKIKEFSNITIDKKLMIRLSLTIAILLFITQTSPA